ncbi:MAG: beta-ketoacyl-ACP synthase III [Streptosporangiales bacterium]|nr:beta-ketoacyl-ACP synthase III [Streptosporangiales bacterium]
MKSTTPVPGARILALGEYRPARVVTNDEVAPQIDSSDEWIRSHTGIVTRRWADTETVADMATAAGEKALAKAGVDPADVDLVIVANCTHHMQTPGASSEVEERLGLVKAGAMDLNAACAGFAYTLAVANDMIRAGTATYVLVIGAERFREIIDPYDRTMAMLWGDGAGAALVGPSDEPGIGPVAWGSDGGRIETVQQEPNYIEVFHAAQEGKSLPPTALRMQGPSVFRWASYEMVPVAKKALELAGVEPEELSAFVPHQANVRIIDVLARGLKLPDSVVVAKDIEGQGNTSSASIPLALHALLERGEVESGSPALFIGFGAGLTYAAQVALIP